MHNALPRCYTDITEKLHTQNPPDNQTNSLGGTFGTLFCRRVQSELLLQMTWKPECSDTLNSRPWKSVTLSNWGSIKTWLRKRIGKCSRSSSWTETPGRANCDIPKKHFSNRLIKKRCILQHIAWQVLGSSSLAKVSAGKKVLPLLISRSERLGRNTLKDERCL